MTVLNEFTFLNGVTAPCYSKELLNNAGGGLVLAVSDGFDGSITVQGKQNGEWYTLGVVDLAKAGAADAITAAGSYSVIGVAGFSHIRLNLTAVSGTATVSGRLTTEPGTILAASSSESGGGGGSGLPAVTSSDNGKMLQVDDGEWSVVNYPIKSENSVTLCDDTVTLTNEDVDVPFEAGADISNPSSWTVKINGIEIPKKTSKAFEYSDYENETIYGVSLIGDTWKVYVTDLQDAAIPGDYSVEITSKSVILDENFVKALAVFFNLPNERMGNGTMTINVSVNAETGKPSYSFTWTGGLG